MLRGIRKASENWLGRTLMTVLLSGIAGSFVIWGINDIFRGRSNTTLAKIGGTEISTDQFSQAYNDRLQQLSSQLGHPIPREQANALGLDRQVLGQLVADAGLDQLAARMRLGVPMADLVQHVMSAPQFQTPTGQFDRARFESFLQSIGYSEQRFFDEERRTIPRREITDTVSGDIVVPQTYLAAINQFQNEERSITYVMLGPQQAGEVPQPTTEQLQKYFDDRRMLFRAPEYRTVVVLAVTPAELAKSIKVSDADVKKNYEANLKQYITPERRHVEQIVFPTLAEAQAASARIKSGTSFTQIAVGRGLKESDIDLGDVAKSGIIDPAVAEAAFSLKVGEVSAPIKGTFGTVIVTVLSIEPGETKPLEVVAPFIRSDIALERAKSLVQDIHDRIEDARGGGSTLAQAAQQVNLAAVTIDVDRSGRDPSGKLVATMPAAPAVINGAFSSDVGDDTTYPIDADGGYVWYEVEAIAAARDRTLDEVKSEVERRWHDDQIAERLRAKAADLLGKLKGGNALEALAAADGTKVETAAGLKRGVSSPGIPARVGEAVFHTGQDAFGSSQGDSPTQWIVFKVTDVKAPSLDVKSADGKKLDQLLQRAISDDILGQYIAWLEKDLGTTVNQSMLAQAAGGAAPDNE